MTRARRALLLLGLVAAAAGPALGPAAPASAATYRYWSYWHWSGGAWSYSNLGPDSYHVHDTSVEGWRFGRGAASSSATPPRIGADYDTLCPQQPTPPAGQRRVALVVDFGTEADSPGGYGRRCLTVPTDADSGTQVLRAAGRTLRFDNSGLLCAIDGYPKPPECGEVVTESSPAARPSPSARPSRRPTAAGAGAVRPATQRPASPLPQVVPERTFHAGPATRSPGAPSTGTSRSPSPRPSSAPPAAVPPTATVGATPVPSFSDLATPRVRRSSGPPWGLLLGVTAVVALGGAALARARRR